MGKEYEIIFMNGWTGTSEEYFNYNNLVYLMREGGYHDMDSVVECTYNGLQKVFR